MLGVIVLTRDGKVAEVARGACRTVNRPITVAADLAAVVEAARGMEWSELLLDGDHPDAEAAAEMVIDRRRIVCVVRDAVGAPVRGAHLVVHISMLGRVLLELAGPRAVRVPSHVERLLDATVLGGALEDALDAAAHQIAIAFGAARCVISERAEATPTDGQTFDPVAWAALSRRFVAAANFDATFVMPSPQNPAESDSYVAVPLDSPRGAGGFLALVATRARVFSEEERASLRAAAVRIGRELRWRAIYDRNAEELEKTLSAPGLDPLLGIWNRHALAQITHSYLSNARRCKLPLTVLAVRVVDLEGINTRHGMATGDRILRRTADALRPALRAEDLVGRYSGTTLVVVLQNAGVTDAQRVAQRIQAMLGERAVELPGGEQLAIATTIGILPPDDTDDGATLLKRAVRATMQARPNEIVLLASTPGANATGRWQLPFESPELQHATFGGSYRIRHEISRGGMGVVYRADDLALERPVAIKMLRPELAQNEELLKHLRREAALLARVHHPNLVQIYNFGQTEGDCYFVMELVEGETMQQTIDRHVAAKEALPISELVVIVEQIASALDALHERGIVHRDVKPANFIRDPFTGRSVLVDVGIAHRFGELSKQAGTPGFMAPEVIQGVAASPRSDVYGLAASVFAIATLTAPWGEGPAIDIIVRQCSAPPPRASAIRPELAPIDDLLADALSFEVDKRPRSAGELARSISRALGIVMPSASQRKTRHRMTDGNGAVGGRTRGVVFRALERVLPVHDANRLRDAIGATHPELAEALGHGAPLAWHSSDLLVDLLAFAPAHVGHEAGAIARQLARETLKSSFHSFFPASPATLHPERTLSAIRGIWTRYHTWGNPTAIPVSGGEMVVNVAGSLRVAAMCEFTNELLKTLVEFSNGREPIVAHEACELEGAESCAFRVTWQE